MYPSVRRLGLFFCVLLAAAFPLLSQDTRSAEPFSFVGMSLAELLSRFGAPRTVYAARGDEVWQDDVVFEYGEGDFYVFRDRVWQVGLKAAYGIKLGDSRPAALLVLGDNARDQGEYALLSLPGGGWPLMLRFHFNAGLVSAIFIYRPDF